MLKELLGIFLNVNLFIGAKDTSRRRAEAIRRATFKKREEQQAIFKKEGLPFDRSVKKEISARENPELLPQGRGGSTRARPNTELKFTKKDGTKVFGKKSEAIVVPLGARPSTSATNLTLTQQQAKEFEIQRRTEPQEINVSPGFQRRVKELEEERKIKDFVEFQRTGTVALTASPGLAARVEELKAERTETGASLVLRTTDEAVARQPRTLTDSEIAELREGPGRIEAAQQPITFLGKIRDKLNRQSFNLERKIRLGIDSPIDVPTQVGIGLGKSFLSTAETVEALVTRPRETIQVAGAGIKEVGRRIKTGEGFPELGQTIRAKPFEVAGFIGGEITQAKIIGFGAEKAGNLLGRTRAVFSGKFRSARTGKIQITSPATGELIDVDVVGSFKRFEEPVAKQARLAGKEITAVSGQRGLFKPFKKQVIVDKPLPTPDAPPLERAFFADPAARLRPSRLGITKEAQKSANIEDILSGDVTFRRTRPQGLVFENVKVQDFPKSLKSIEKKLLSGKTLTAAEEAKLVKFQLTPSGQFKPVGFLSREPEVVLAPSEIIIKESKLAETIILGKRVPIFETKIGTASPRTTKLLSKSKLTSKESTELINRLSKETGFTRTELTRSFSSKPVTSKFIAPESISTDLALRGIRARSFIRGISSKPITSRRITPTNLLSSLPNVRRQLPRGFSPIVRLPTSRLLGGSRGPVSPLPRSPIPRSPIPRSPIPGSPGPRVPGPRRPPPRVPGPRIPRPIIPGPGVPPPPIIRTPISRRRGIPKRIKIPRITSRKFKFNPNITAIIEGKKIKKKKLEEFEKGLTGFEERPIPI